MTDTITYGKGTLAYIDAYHYGLIPCKVLEVIQGGSGRSLLDGEIRVKLLETRGPYKKGEILIEVAYSVVPTGHIMVDDKSRVSKDGTRVATNFAWE